MGVAAIVVTRSFSFGPLHLIVAAVVLGLFLLILTAQVMYFAYFLHSRSKPCPNCGAERSPWARCCSQCGGDFTIRSSDNR